jgi:RNA polymerase sigma factor (sigma-70 family)
MERMKALALLATVGPMDGPEDRSEPAARPLEAAKAGGLAAFELLMRQYERLVLVTALRLLGVLEDAQDASQEVFLRLYRNLNRVEASSNLLGWLYRVTVNVCHDVRRKRRVSTPVEDAGRGGEPSAGYGCSRACGSAPSKGRTAQGKPGTRAAGGAGQRVRRGALDSEAADRRPQRRHLLD